MSGSESSLVEFWGVQELLHSFLKVCPCKDKAEIKCMGSAGGKTPTELKLSILL
jgi:hypothetical protein